MINYEPSITLALNESGQLQCRLAIETRANAYKIRTREFGDDQISVYFTVRQYWGMEPDMSFLESLRRQRETRRGNPPSIGRSPHCPSPGSGHRVALNQNENWRGQAALVCFSRSWAHPSRSSAYVNVLFMTH